MTEAAASAEAVRRFGVRGVAWHPPYAYRGCYGWCCVGVTDGTEFQHRWATRGVGESFEAAFADADEREL